MTAGTLQVFFAPRRRGAAWCSLAWLAALLFALRAFLPTGFMPDPDALRAGRFQIIYCSAAGPIPAGMAMAGVHMAGMHMTGMDITGMDVTGMGMSGHHMADARHSMAGSHPGQEQSPDGSGMPADCPFGLTGAYTYSPPVFAVAAPALALAWHVPAALPSVPPPSGIVAGPPVGSRAPPPGLA